MNNYIRRYVYGQAIFYYDDAGKFHRTDGPAIEDANGYKAWYINGVRMDDEKEFLETKITLLIKEVLENS